MKIRKKNLAFFGGKKAITYKSPHWKWPPFSKEKYDSIKSYYLNGEKKKKKGYPKIVEVFEKNFKNTKKLNMRYLQTQEHQLYKLLFLLLVSKREMKLLHQH